MTRKMSTVDMRVVRLGRFWRYRASSSQSAQSVPSPQSSYELPKPPSSQVGDGDGDGGGSEGGGEDGGGEGGGGEGGGGEGGGGGGDGDGGREGIFEGGDKVGGEPAARMKTRDTGPSLRLQVSFVPTSVDASGLCEAEVFATGSADTLRSRSTRSDEEARVANVGAKKKKAASRSSIGST